MVNGITTCMKQHEGKAKELPKRFTISETDHFNSSDFPEIVKELAEIKERVKPLRLVDNDIIIVSYLKDHAIRTDLAQSHAKLIEILTSKNTCHFLEDLFLSSRENVSFRLSLENYVIDQLNK